MKLFGNIDAAKKAPAKKKVPAKKEEPKQKKKRRTTIHVSDDHPLHDFLRNEIKYMDGQPNWDYYYRTDVPMTFGVNSTRLQSSTRFLDRAMALRKIRSNVYLTTGDSSTPGYDMTARKQTIIDLDKLVAALEATGMRISGHLHLYSPIPKDKLEAMTKQAEHLQNEIQDSRNKTSKKRAATKEANKAKEAKRPKIKLF